MEDNQSGISLGDPAFDEDPQLNKLRHRFYIWMVLFVASIVSLLVSILIASQVPEGSGFSPLLTMIPPGLALLVVSVGAIYSQVTMERALRRYKIEKLARAMSGAAFVPQPGLLWSGHSSYQQQPHLAARLRELEEAYRQGLITAEELAAKRAELIREV